VDGARKDARLSYPTALAFGPDGSLFVVESIAGRLRQVDAEGQVTTVAAELDAPAAVATAPDGRVFVSCAHNGQIIEISGTDQRVIANQAGLLGDRTGPALDAWLRPEAGLVFADDRLVFSDMANEKIRELVFGADGASDYISTLVGDDATFADGQRPGLALPRGLCAYRDGYAVADTRHARIVYVEPFDDEPEPVR
jgi:glucose/arabinose dehydrogenase